MPVRKINFSPPTSWPRLCSLLHNLNLILSKRDWEREHFSFVMKFSHVEREQVFTILSEKRSICDDCQEELTPLIMRKILVMSWKCFNLHLNFRRNSAKTILCIYSSHLQGYLKETELFLDLAVFCKFIIMQLQDWEALDVIISWKGAGGEKQAGFRFGFSHFNSYPSMIFLIK